MERFKGHPFLKIYVNLGGPQTGLRAHERAGLRKSSVHMLFAWLLAPLSSIRICSEPVCDCSPSFRLRCDIPRIVPGPDCHLPGQRVAFRW